MKRPQRVAATSIASGFTVAFSHDDYSLAAAGDINSKKISAVYWL